MLAIFVLEALDTSSTYHALHTHYIHHALHTHYTHTYRHRRYTCNSIIPFQLQAIALQNEISKKNHIESIVKE